MTIEYSQEECEKIVKEVFQNFPEFAIYSFQCFKYDYDNFIYEFIDLETGTHYTVLLPMAVKGFRLFAERLLNGDLFFSGFNTPVSLLDGGNYDASSVDAILQYSTLGELIYG